MLALQSLLKKLFWSIICYNVMISSYLQKIDHKITQSIMLMKVYGNQKKIKYGSVQGWFLICSFGRSYFVLQYDVRI